MFEISLRLKPERIDQLRDLATELRNEKSILYRFARRYTRDALRAFSKARVGIRRLVSVLRRLDDVSGSLGDNGERKLVLLETVLRKSKESSRFIRRRVKALLLSRSAWTLLQSCS